MKISTKLRYGLRAMIDIAIHQGEGPVLVKNIAKRQAVSKKYLDTLLAELKSAGLLRSLRGAKGGYVLAKPMDQITIENIALALEGPMVFVDCVMEPSCCELSEDCVALEFWTEIYEMVSNHLRKTKLSELVERQKEKLESKSLMYYL